MICMAHLLPGIELKAEGRSKFLRNAARASRRPPRQAFRPSHHALKWDGWAGRERAQRSRPRYTGNGSARSLGETPAVLGQGQWNGICLNFVNYFILKMRARRLADEIIFDYYS